MAENPFAEFGGTEVALSPEEQARRDYEEAISSGTLSVSAVKPGNKPPPEGDPFSAFGGTLLGTQPSDAIPRSETTAGGLAGAAIRGAAPTAVGAGVGGAIGLGIGALAGGAGAVPGAMLGARVGAAAAPLIGDLGVGAINSLFQTKFTQPTEALNYFLTAIGVPEAQTEAERIVQATSGAVAGTVGTMGLGGAMSGAGNQTVRRVGEFLAANPTQQVASAATGGAAGQEVQELGGGKLAQFVGNVGASILTGKLMGSSIVPASTTAARQQLVREGQQAGIPIKTSDVFQSKPGIVRNTGEAFPIVGTRNLIGRQVAGRREAAQNLLADYGANPGLVARDQDLTRLYNSFAIARQQQLTAASNLKQQSMATAARTNFPVPTPNSIAAIDNQIQALAGSMNEREIVPVLQRFRAAILGSNLDALENARRELGRQFTSRGLEHIRTRGEQIINSIYGPVRQDIREFINTHGAPGDVRRWEVANRRIRLLAEDLNETALRSVLREGESTPETIQRLIFNSPTSRIANLYRSLPLVGQAQFRTAVIREAAQNSLVEGRVDLRQFAANIRNLERQLNIGFTPSQRQQVEGLGRVLEATQSAEKPLASLPKVVGATTIAATSHFLHAGWLASFLTATGITEGIAAMSRIYESAPVRNALIQLARVRVGTVEYDDALRGTIQAINTEVTKETEKQEKKK
jgi:hypothetical protein